MTQNVLITGATGYIGGLLVQQILDQKKIDGNQYNVFALGRKPVQSPLDQKGVNYIQLDIRSDELEDVVKNNKINVVVHMAAVVNPGKDVTKEDSFDIDVNSTEKLLKACAKYEVEHFIYLSSGAVYGYHPDHPEWIKEDWPIRGNEAYPYAYHKRLNEETLERYRKECPQMKQLVLRVPAVLGESTDSQITDLLDKNPMITVGGSDCPFVFIWDQDLVRCIYQGIDQKKEGIFNISGDGKLSVYDLAKITERKVLNFPTWLMRGIMGTAKSLGITKNGAEVVVFVLYRPVLSNEKMKKEFGFIPEKTSKEAFEYYLRHQSK